MPRTGPLNNSCVQNPHSLEKKTGPFFFPSDLPPDRIPRALPGPDPARVRLLHEGGDGLGPVRVGPQDQAGAAKDAALAG